jgi:DNA-binding transcriptional ArsR family regulator
MKIASAPHVQAGPAALEFVDEPARLAAALTPERLRLLRELRSQPDSAAGLARRLGERRQRLNYHLRALEEAGLVELSEERQRRGCVERVLRVTARSFVVDPSALGGLDLDAAGAADRFSATYQIALAARTVRELAGLRERAEEERKRLATGAIDARVVLARPADFRTFMEELAEAVAQVVARHQDETGAGRPFRVIAGAYQAPDAGAAGSSDRTVMTEEGAEP